MIRNMHPADELAMVRAGIERLKSREAFLRDKLTQNILENEAYWSSQRVEHVRMPNL